MLHSLPFSFVLIVVGLACANEPIRSWYPYRPQSLKQRREPNFIGLQPQSGGLEISACPLECRCFAKTVRCSGISIKDIPRNLPIDSERM